MECGAGCKRWRTCKKIEFRKGGKGIECKKFVLDESKETYFPEDIKFKGKKGKVRKR